MGLVEFLVLVLVAAICGALGQSLVGYSGGGCLASTLVGVIGAYIGVWLARQLGLPLIFALSIGGQGFPIVWSVIGAALFSVLLALLSRAARG